MIFSDNFEDITKFIIKMWTKKSATVGTLGTFDYAHPGYENKVQLYCVQI